MNFEVEARYGRIEAAKKRNGVSRSAVYRLAGEHPDLLVKMGNSTFVNFEVLDRIYANLPRARIAAPRAA